MADKEKVLAALQKMDVNNDNHWTVSGEAKLETLKFMLGGEMITRDELNTIAPGFSRDAMRAYLANQAAPKTEAGNGGQAPAPAVAGAGTDDKPDDEPEQPEVAVGNADREAEIEALAKKVNLANEEIQRCQRVQAEMSERIAVLQRDVQQAQSALNKIAPPPTHIETIQGYLSTNKRLMKRRGEARRAVVNSGVSLSALSAAIQPSALDQALRERPRNR